MKKVKHKVTPLSASQHAMVCEVAEKLKDVRLFPEKLETAKNVAEALNKAIQNGHNIFNSSTRSPLPATSV